MNKSFGKLEYFVFLGEIWRREKAVKAERGLVDRDKRHIVFNMYV